VFFNTTTRQTVHVSIEAERIRLRLSNEFGGSPLHIAKMTISLAEKPGSRILRSDLLKDVTFSNQSSTAIPAGAVGTTDPIAIRASPATDLSISIHLATGQSGTAITAHPGSRTTSWFQHGDQTRAAALSPDRGAARAAHWYFLSAVQALLPASAAALVVVGDSITDGRGSTDDGNDRWPDLLAARLRASRRPTAARVAVVNVAAGGNAVVRGGIGTPAARRVRRDVLSRAGVRWALVFEGVNDIGGAGPSPAAQRAVGDALVAAYERMVGEMRGAGIGKVFGATIAPFAGSGYGHAERERTRARVNEWIRRNGTFDGVIDFDAAVRDPEKKDRLAKRFDTGDHLHLNPVGYQALANSVNLELFR
jgi:lysophospholipase L1-like esterase